MHHAALNDNITVNVNSGQTPPAKARRHRRRSSRIRQAKGQNYPQDDGRLEIDQTERRRIQNKLAQRRYRQRQKEKDIEQKRTESNLQVQSTPPHLEFVGPAPEDNLSGSPQQCPLPHVFYVHSVFSSVSDTGLPSPMETVSSASTAPNIQFENPNTPELDETWFSNWLLNTTPESPSYVNGRHVSYPPANDSETSGFPPIPPLREEVNYANDIPTGKLPLSPTCTPITKTTSQTGRSLPLTAAQTGLKSQCQTSPYPVQPTVQNCGSVAYTASPWEVSKGKTLLHLWAERGNGKMVQSLLGSRADINRQDFYGRTALHLAAKNSHLEVVTKLLEGGADMEIVDSEGFRALHVAGSEEVSMLLIQKGADLNSRIGM